MGVIHLLLDEIGQRSILAHNRRIIILSKSGVGLVCVHEINQALAGEPGIRRRHGHCIVKSILSEDGIGVHNVASISKLILG